MIDIQNFDGSFSFKTFLLNKTFHNFSRFKDESSGAAINAGIFGLRGSAKFGGSDFHASQRNFNIGPSPKM